MRKTILAATLVAVSLLPVKSFADGPTLVWGEDSKDEITLDSRMGQSLHATQVMIQIYATLLYLDENDKLWPWLAKSFSTSEDGKTITLELRNDVKFHDGTPFNAEAVKFTFDSIADPATSSRSLDTLGPYESTEVIDDYHLKIHYKHGFATGLISLAQNNLAMVSPTAVKKLGNTAFGAAPVSAGPFKFVSWSRGKEIVLERNPDYNWAPEPMAHKGPPEIAKIIHRNIPEASTRIAALEAGEINVADAVPPLDLRRLADGKNFSTAFSISNGVPMGVFLNTSREPFSDVRVRKALAFAVDRTKLSNSLFFGFTPAQFGALASTMPAYWKGSDSLYPYSTETAGKLLDEAGWKMGANGIRQKDGKPLTAYFPVLFEPDTAVALQSYAKRVGFDIKVETVLKQAQDELILKNAYDALVSRWIQADPSALGTFFYTKNIPTDGKFTYNWSRYSVPSVDAKLDEAARSFSFEQRNAAYQEVQKQVMADAVFLPIHSNVEAIAYSNKFKGFKFWRANGNYLVNFYDVGAAQ